MGLKKPYYRIIRPGVNRLSFVTEFVNDAKYSSARMSQINAYSLLIKDLHALFEYIEPHQKNRNVFSHRVFELLLRTGTEFEANCKGILRANGYKNKNKRKNLDIRDYAKIEQSSKLSWYTVTIKNWHPKPLIMRPFESWQGKKKSPLQWYQAYNSVKHDRYKCFPEAKLFTLLSAIAGLHILLFSQYGHFHWHHAGGGSIEKAGAPIFITGSLFDMEFKNNWTDRDRYDFNWFTLEDKKQRFQKYTYGQEGINVK